MEQGDRPPLRWHLAGAERNFIDKAKLTLVSEALATPIAAEYFFLKYRLDCLEQLDSGQISEQTSKAFMYRLCQNVHVAASQLVPGQESILQLGLEDAKQSADLIRYGYHMTGRGEIDEDDEYICSCFQALINEIRRELEGHRPLTRPELCTTVAGQLITANQLMFTHGGEAHAIMTRHEDLEYYAVNLTYAHMLIEP